MRIIAGIIVSIVFIITLTVFIFCINDDGGKPFGMALWLFIQMVIDFVVALLFI